MDILKFRVRGQALTLLNPNVNLIPVTDAVNQYLCQFEFSEDWVGLNKVVVFKNASYNITKEVYLSTSNECYIPWEVLSNSGTIFLEVIGTEVRGDVITVRIPSTLLGLKWKAQEGLLDVSANVSPTPDLFEQFVNYVREYSTSAIAARDEALIAKDAVVQSVASASASEFAASSYAESAENSASAASSAASSASEAALSVVGVADETKSYAEIASAKAADASTQAEIAAGAKEGAVTAKNDAEAAKDATLSAKETFDNNAESKLIAYNQNALENIASYNANATEKLNVYNSNAEAKLNVYNSNSEIKVTEYNQNSTNKTAEYNRNAETKLNEYNTNANNRVAEFDSHTEQIQADVNELKSEVANKIDAPENPTVGKILKIKSVNEDGTFVCEWAYGESGAVDDVQINGTSIVAYGVANIPIVSIGTSGVISNFDNNFGVGEGEASIGNSSYKGVPVIIPSNNTNISNRTQGRQPIVPTNLDYAVKAAMCDGKGAAWTDDEKTAGRARMSAVSADEVSAMINESLGVIENGSY